MLFFILSYPKIISGSFQITSVNEILSIFYSAFDVDSSIFFLLDITSWLLNEKCLFKCTPCWPKLLRPMVPSYYIFTILIMRYVSRASKTDCSFLLRATLDIRYAT